MNPTIARYIKEAGRRLGLEIQRYATSGCEPAVLERFFGRNPVDLIIDVGANKGQYVSLVRSLGYRGRIVAFEPLGEPHAELVRLAATDRNLAVQPRMALGEHAGKIEMNVTANLTSSSILPMLGSHLAAAPHAYQVGTETVPIDRLDACVSADVGAARFAYLKIDTQGYEAAVLRGAMGVLPAIRAIQLELSLVELYRGQPLMREMLNIMHELGYDLHTFIPGFKDPASGQLIQCDGVFVRRLVDGGKPHG